MSNGEQVLICAFVQASVAVHPRRVLDRQYGRERGDSGLIYNRYRKAWNALVDAGRLPDADEILRDCSTFADGPDVTALSCCAHQSNPRYRHPECDARAAEWFAVRDGLHRRLGQAVGATFDCVGRMNGIIA